MDVILEIDVIDKRRKDEIRPSYEVKVGDIVEIQFGEKISKFEIINIPKVQTKDMPEIIKLL